MILNTRRHLQSLMTNFDSPSHVCVILGVQEKMGVMNRGVVYSLWDYEPQRNDELGFTEGDCMTVLRREDNVEMEWWWARCADQEGYIPRNLLGVS